MHADNSSTTTDTEMTFPAGPVDTLWYNLQLATLASHAEANPPAVQSSATPGDLFSDAALATHDGRIIWLGKTADLPGDYPQRCQNIKDCEGKLVTPGLIDCHTHIVYGGNRAKEFAMRLNGASYEEIARAGGGIISTVAATRKASAAELYDQSAPRLEELMAGGITTIEIKSGYGLSVEDELKMLRVARQLGRDYPVDVVTTFLGAHALPPEYSGRADDYIDLVCDAMLPAVAQEQLADHVDAFCEGIAFSPQQVERVFKAAQHYGLPVKLHAEQLSDLKGAVLAAQYGALSVDHLEYLAAEDVPVLAEQGTVAVLLPGAFYCLRETRLPPLAALREHKVPIALATDSNPGSSPVGSLPLMMNMACTLFRMTPEEALAGVTRHAARALGMQEQVGTLGVGKRANLVLWDVKDPAELSYRIGGNACEQVIYNGKVR